MANDLFDFDRNDAAEPFEAPPSRRTVRRNRERRRKRLLGRILLVLLCLAVGFGIGGLLVRSGFSPSSLFSPAPTGTPVDQSCLTVDTLEASSFVTDLSEGAQVSFAAVPDFTTPGTREVELVLTGSGGRKTHLTAALTVVEDSTAPVIQGVADRTISLEEAAATDYGQGITVTDDYDREVALEVDAGQVDPTRAGSYTVTYRATDRSGNTAETAAVFHLVPPEEATNPPVDWSWFDDAVFVGDSVSLKLKYYATQMRKSDPGFLGKAQFLTAGSLGSGNALWEVSSESVHPSYQGKKMLLEESIPKTGAKKVFIMLGINDIAVYGIDGSVKNLETLLDRIAAAVPEVQFYVQSATPIHRGCEKRVLNNANLEIYNQSVQALCERRGWHFMDVASVLRDAEGFLPSAYCSDREGMGIHFTDAACQVWLDSLKTHAAS